MSAPLRVETTVACASAARDLWPVITDTERLNRATGMDRLALTPISGAGAARHLVRTSMGGFRVEYEERPYQWTYPKRFRVVRVVRSGPLDWFELDVVLSGRDDGGTDVRIAFVLAPRIRVLSPFFALGARRQLGVFERELRRIDSAVAKGEKPGLSARTRPRGDALERARDALVELGSKGEVDVAIAERLVALVRDGSDLDVSRIRPYELADAWGADRTAVLSTCLRAVRAGLLDLRWELVCPSCRTAAETIATLSELAEHASCHLCDIAFDVELDQSVEATFAPSPGVRAADAGPYCIGGPARTPHVVAQMLLPARGTAELAAPEEPGRYRLFVRGGATRLVEVADSGDGEVALDGRDLEGSTVVVRPGAPVRVANDDGEERHVKIERTVWARHAATARDVTALPAFRRDFSKDTLRPGTALKISRVAIFFSDLTGSTQLYAAIGDAAAFKLVQDHFELLIAIVERHGGTVVKTIGDAVMAVFSDELAGVAASAEILRAFESFRRREPDYEKTHVKLGIHAGSCYVVTANGVLDYFGQTVNVAARLQGEAKSGELVIPDAVAERAIEAGVLARADVAERYDAKLKGVDGVVSVARVRTAAR